MFCCRHFYRVRIKPHCKHRSIEFLTTQTDQSKGDIVIDYVLSLFHRFEEGLRYNQLKSFDKKKLYDKGISGKFLKSIKAMHTTVEQRAKINNQILPTISSVLGLKQGDN